MISSPSFTMLMTLLSAMIIPPRSCVPFTAPGKGSRAPGSGAAAAPEGPDGATHGEAW